MSYPVATASPADQLKSLNRDADKPAGVQKRIEQTARKHRQALARVEAKITAIEEQS